MIVCIILAKLIPSLPPLCVDLIGARQMHVHVTYLARGVVNVLTQFNSLS